MSGLITPTDFNRFSASTEDTILAIRLCFRFFLSASPGDMSPQLRSLIYDPFDVKITLRQNNKKKHTGTPFSSPTTSSSSIAPEDAEEQTAASVLLDIADVLENQYRLPHPYSDPENWVFWGPSTSDRNIKLAVKEVGDVWPFIPLYRCAKPDGMWVLDAQISCKLGPPRFEDVVYWQFGPGGLKEGKRNKGATLDVGTAIEYKELVEKEKNSFGLGSINPYLVGGEYSGIKPLEV